MKRASIRVVVAGLGAAALACGGGAAAPNSPSAPTGPGSTSPVVTVSSLRVSAQRLAVPLTNGRGLHVADVPVTLHVADGALVATRWGATPSPVTIASGVSNPTLAGRGSQLLAVWVDVGSGLLLAADSANGGASWSGAQTLGETGIGPAVPTACLYRSGGVVRRLAAWSDMPTQSNGPLRIAAHDGSRWLSPTTHAVALSAGAALYCADDATPEIVWRDDRHGAGNSALHYGTVHPDGSLASDAPVVQPGFDPSYCGSGGTRWAGYHKGTNDAHLVRAAAGWASLSEIDLDTAAGGSQLDDSAKFVAVDCAGSVVVAAWGDWPSKGDAAARSDASRRLGLVLSRDGGSSTWHALRPAGEATEQGPATVAVGGSTAYVMWRAPGEIKLARID